MEASLYEKLTDVYNHDELVGFFAEFDKNNERWTAGAR